MFGVLGVLQEITFQDGFDRADSATVGNDWVEVGPWEIASGQVYRPLPADTGLDRIYRDTLVGDGFAQCVPLSIGVGPITRFDNGAIGGYWLLWDGSVIRLDRINTGGGTVTTLGTSPLVVNLTGDILTIESQGSAQRAYLNGELVISATDGSWSSGVRGICAASGDEAIADDYAEGNI